jgi:hypothetical protein
LESCNFQRHKEQGSKLGEYLPCVFELNSNNSVIYNIKVVKILLSGPVINQQNWREIQQALLSHFLILIVFFLENSPLKIR